MKKAAKESSARFSSAPASLDRLASDGVKKPTASLRPAIFLRERFSLSLHHVLLCRASEELNTMHVPRVEKKQQQQQKQPSKLIQSKVHHDCSKRDRVLVGHRVPT